MGKYFGLIFCGLFAAVGIGMFAFKAMPMVVDWVKVHSWQSVQAKLIDHSLAYSRGSEGGTTYKAKATYEYYYNNQKYTGKRVGIGGGSDNIGSYHQDMQRKLSRIGNKPMTVWVNPNDPTQSIIDRSFRFGLLAFYFVFVLVFGGFGLGGMFLVWKYRNAGDKLDNSDPEKPWTEYAEWLDPIKKDNQKTANFVGLGFALVWIALTSVGFFAAIQESWFYGVFVLVFIAPGFYFLFKCIESIKSYRQTGLMPLSLDPFPGSVGGQLGGVIYVDKRFTAPPKNTDIEVQCVRKIRRRNDDESSEKKVWYRSAKFNWEMGEFGWQLRFCFDIPNDQTVSSPPLDSNGIEWRVTLNAETESGIEFKRRYDDIPVFATGRNASFNDLIADHVAASIIEQHQSLVADVLDLQSDHRGYSLYYPMLRSWLGGIFAIVGLFFTVVGLNIPDIIFNIVFPLLGIPCFLGGLYSLGNSLKVRIGAEGISSQRKLFGFALKPQFLASFDYEKFKKKQSHSTSTGSETTEYFSILAIGKSKQKITVATDIEGEMGAKAAIEKLESVIKELGYIE